MNEGCFAPLVINFPRGTLVNPNPPAACGGRIVTVTAAMEAIVDALSSALPDQAVASSGIVHLYAMSGSRPERPSEREATSGAPSPWLVMAMDFGGLGARSMCDGPDATGAFVLGGRGAVLQVEPFEAQYPVLIEHVRARIDSGGPGEHRGGLGIDTAIRLLSDAELVVRGDRMVLAPTGRKGGESGGQGYWRSQHPDGSVDDFAHRQSHIRLADDDVFLIGTSGGGGLGSPLDRDPAAVARDVVEERVSAARARDSYGVVLDGDNVVDTDATDALRDEMRSSR
jgi:N-methylhydantoinase B